MPNPAAVRLPRQWPDHVKSAVVHAIGLASVVVSYARGRAKHRRSLRVRLEQAEAEIALLREELAIKDGRWQRAKTRRRPHCTPIQRMRILQLRSARGWNLEKTARVFLVDLQTLMIWMRRLDEPGERPLVQTVEPVNRYPDLVRHLVREFERLFPAMGNEHIANVLARAGHWVSWFPCSLPQRWPFCWWVGIAIDQMSRAVVGNALFARAPTSGQVQRFLDRAIRATGSAPRYVVTDKGKQSWCRSFKRWCKRRDARPRCGAIGQSASIALVERFIRSMKQEASRRALVPASFDPMKHEVALYA